MTHLAILYLFNDSQWLLAVVTVIADKPAESWSDEDAIAFEVKLADIVRKFENLEAIQTEVNSQQKLIVKASKRE